MIPPLSEIFPYIVSAGGAFAWVAAYNTRKASRRKMELEADAQWQEIYRGIIGDLRLEVGQLKEQIFMLRETVESYKATCDGCPNKKIKL